MPFIEEIFASVQGEGPFIGMPAIFVRFAGCTMNCPWCDTKYAWQRDSSSLLGKDKIYDKIEATSPHSHNLVITGGEPMEQLPECKDLLRFLTAYGYQLHLETNGFTFDQDVLDYFYAIVVSPKLEVRPDEDEWYEEYVRSLMDYADYTDKVYFKWVIDTSRPEAGIQNDIRMYLKLCKDWNASPKQIYFQPLYEDDMNIESMMKAYNILWTNAMRVDSYQHFRVLPQLHRWVGVK
jgi:7-carboxy-7-deazaguanine synthase